MKRIQQAFVVLACMLLVQVAYAQRTVSGTVKSAEDGAAIPGVNVLLKGTTTGVITDLEGNYRISVPKDGGTLVFSFIGMDPQEIPIGTQTVIHVALSGNVQELSEVVVTGTGVATDKKKLSIAVESISAKDLPAAPTASIDQALVGKVAGAQITSTSGNPGDPISIVLRGINSIQGGTQPLIILDGVQMAATNLNSLDLSNVDHVEVVQGAAASSLYGAQGANGVIQIFSKKGTKGKTVVSYSTSYAENSFINSGNVSKAKLHPWLTDANNNIVTTNGDIITYNQYGSIEGLSYEYGGGTRYAMLDPRNIANKKYDANLKYYDQIAQVFQKGHTVNNTLNISGASDKSDYAFTASSSQTLTAVMKNGNYDRYNFTSNIGTEVFKGLKIRSITQLIFTENNIDPFLGGGGGILQGQANYKSRTSTYGVWDFLNTSPFFDLRYQLADGTHPAYQYADFVSVNNFNPYYTQEYAKDLDKKTDIIQNFNANYRVNKFLELDAKYGLNYRTENATWMFYNQSGNVNSNYYTAYSGYFASDNTGEMDKWNYRSTFQNFIGTAFIHTNFQDDFGSSLPIETSTQVTYDYRQQRYKEYDTYGLGLPTVPPFLMTSTSSQGVYMDYSRTFITYGYLVNQIINYGRFAGLTGGFRSDWSSAFGGGSKPFTFPHVSGFVSLSEFAFWNPVKNTLPYFKLRAAYGQAGIQPGAFDRYPVLDQDNLGNQIVYSNQSTTNNPDLKVEVSSELEIGTDFTININQNRPWLKSLNASFSYWERKSKNVIYSVSVAPSTGSTGQLTNSVDMSSKGIQMQLNLPLWQSKNFSWDLTTNFGHQKSMIDHIAGGVEIITTSSAGSTALTLKGGQRIGQIYGYKALTSIKQKRENGERYISEDDASNYQLVHGRVVNKTTKGLQFTEETHSIGSPTPKFNAAFINTFSYKQFITLSVQFDWVFKAHKYNQLKEWMYRDGISSDFAKKVTINDTTAAYTAYWGSAYSASYGSLYGGGNNGTKDFFWEDASFVRLRNITLGVDFAKIFDLKSFRQLQLVFTGRNILTFTKYTGFDPELTSGSANSAYDMGVDNGTLPNTKSYQVGLNVTF